MSDFMVERVALHLVDRKEDEPQLSEQEFNLATFKRDKPALEAFFNKHLKKIWVTPESKRTLAARFNDDQIIPQHYHKLKNDSSQFFQCSRDMALRLHEKSRHPRIVAGVLMVLWFRKTDDDRPYLALFKMKPDQSNKIFLPKKNEEQEFLLDLAVQHIANALPDPGEKDVLKWAVIPHPTRDFDVKMADNEAWDEKVAKYFKIFLGCEDKIRPSEKKQFESLMDALPAYAEKYHEEEDWKPAVSKLVRELKREDVVTNKVLEDKIRELETFGDSFDSKIFQRTLEEKGAEDLYIPHKFLNPKIKYTVNNISIEGPEAEIKNLVKETDGRIKININTTNYEKKYVW